MPRAISRSITGSNFDIAKTRRTRPVARAHHLLRLALAAVRNTPQRPVLARSDGLAGVPEFRGDAAISRVFEHANAFAVADLPSDFTAELEVIALVVDRPALVGLHVNCVFHAAHHLVERLLPRQHAYVG